MRPAMERHQINLAAGDMPRDVKSDFIGRCSVDRRLHRRSVCALQQISVAQLFSSISTRGKELGTAIALPLLLCREKVGMRV